MKHTSPLEYALVGLLKQKPQSGYDLRKQFVTTPIRHFSDSPGSIYPALRRLQSRRWLSVTTDDKGRKRQIFRVTKTGDRAFTEWLQRPATREDVIWRLPEMLIRFAFQGGNVPRRVTLAFLNQLELHTSSYARELHDYAKQAGLANSISTGALAFANGMDGYAAQLAWIKRSRKKIMEASS